MNLLALQVRVQRLKQIILLRRLVQAATDEASNRLRPVIRRFGFGVYLQGLAIQQVRLLLVDKVLQNPLAAVALFGSGDGSATNLGVGNLATRRVHQPTEFVALVGKGSSLDALEAKLLEHALIRLCRRSRALFAGLLAGRAGNSGAALRAMPAGLRRAAFIASSSFTLYSLHMFLK